MMANPGGDPFDGEGGIIFSAMPPSKKYRDIQSLSGGEKSIASLALLLAMHACSPPPFFILDEVR
jgi:structural maintenance of chromosome 1